ncbi:MAG TPA: lipoyl(octanoyl) transferase LipB [Bacteroidota bacterium]
MECLVVDIGPSAYREAWDLQRAVWNARVEGSVPDVLILTEHRHVYTLGKGADESHLLATKEELRQKGVEVFEIDRGGDVTYHGPGQIVGYPIVDLNDHYRDVHRYLRDLEEVVIRTLLSLGVEGSRIEGLTGVWVDGCKIAAIGVKVSRWVTMHGFALNVNTDLSYFNGIVPCGIFHKGVTSLQQVLARDVDMEQVKAELSKRFGEVFGLTMKSVTGAEFNVHSEAKKELEWHQQGR